MEKDRTKVQQKENSGIIDKAKNFLFVSRLRVGITAVILIILVFLGWQNFRAAKVSPQYQTAIAEKGTLVSSISESGQAVVTSRISITTQASGVISEVDAANGDLVTQGQKIAVVSLDQAGQQRQAQTRASYLSAKSSLDNANAQLYSLQSSMYSKWNTYKNLAENSTYQNSDGSPNTANRILPQFTIAQDDWLAAEAVYKNQQGIIEQAKAALNSAWLSYQASSNIITAPVQGKISDLILSSGMQIGSLGSVATTVNGTGGTNSNSSSQFIATIKTEGNPVVAVNLSEIDAARVKEGQKATIKFDALPNKSFTGKVLGINTTGVNSNGVTTYPATIQLDSFNDSILPNMSLTANIITSVKNDVLIIPSTAVQTVGGQTTVRILQNGKLTSVFVEVGDSSDTQTEIISGLNGGETVVTGFTSSGQTGGSAASSPFSSGFRFGGGGFGGGRGGR